MDMELSLCPKGRKGQLWKDFLARAGLKAEEDTEQTVLIWDEEQIIACASRKGNLLKCIAVDPARQGEGLTASLLTALRQEAHREGYSHLFLYTKPRNKMLFEPLFFYPVAQTKSVLLMESARGGIRSFLDGLDAPVRKGKIGAIVAVQKGAGADVVLALCHALTEDFAMLEVASNNERAVRLYDRLGFLPTAELSRWYLVK